MRRRQEGSASRESTAPACACDPPFVTCPAHMEDRMKAEGTYVRGEERNPRKMGGKAPCPHAGGIGSVMVPCGRCDVCIRWEAQKQGVRSMGDR